MRRHIENIRASSINLCVLFVGHAPYISVDAGQATDLAEAYSGPNDGIDLFMVQAIIDAGGWSNSNGPCDKDDKGRTGAVVEVNTGSDDFLGTLVAHEVGLYLGLVHTNAATNLMGVDSNNDGIGEISLNSRDITSGQRTTMRSSCWVRHPCQERAMATKPNSPPLTPPFRRVLALEAPPFGRPRPTPAELEGIRAVLAGGPSAAKRLNLARAMFIAADSAPDAVTAGLIARILKDGAVDASLRPHAAAVLGDTPTRSATKALTEALAGSSTGLEATLLEPLAKLGDVEAARIIGARPASRSFQLTRLRDFARAAIADRTDTPIDPRAERVLVAAGVEVAISAEPPAELAAVLQRFRGSTSGLRLRTELGYGFTCGDARHLVLLSDEFQRGKVLEALRARRRIAGIVAMQDERGAGSYLARRLIVTRPRRDGVDLLDVTVVTLAGEV